MSVYVSPATEHNTTLPADAHWCPDCDYGIEYGPDDYPSTCLGCVGVGWRVCEDADCPEHS